MDKSSASAAADGMPSMQFDGRRLLADPESAVWHGHGDDARVLEMVQQGQGLLRAIALASIGSLLLLCGLFAQTLWQSLAPLDHAWLLVVLGCAAAGVAAWPLMRQPAQLPAHARYRQLAAMAWGLLTLAAWGLAMGQALTLPWGDAVALRVVLLGLGAGLLLLAMAHWRPALLLSWVALLGGQYLAAPADDALLPLLGFDLLLLGVGVLLQRTLRERTRWLIAERHSRAELARHKAAPGDSDGTQREGVWQRTDFERALQDARAAVEVANRAKTEFLATMSHEVRTPLNGIVPILEMLRETPLQDQQRELLNTAYRSSRHLLRIINGVLDYAKVESGQLELECIEIDLRELLESVTRLLARNAERRGLRLQCRIADDVPRRVLGDPIRLRQVVSNLVSNAIKFTEQGSIDVELRRRRADRKEVELVFSVTDTGLGMSRETQRRLFRPFSQGDASTTRKHGGTGLGLVICKRLVELMGGRIGVKSQPGKGSSFWFVLPMATSSVGSVAARHDLSGLRVLSVSDDAATVARLAELLRDWGMAVENRRSLPAATARLSAMAELGGSWTPQLLIVSLAAAERALPGLLERLRGDSALADLQVLVVTPAAESLHQRTRVAGLSFLPAPIDPGRLRSHLERLFEVQSGQSEPDPHTAAELDGLTLDAELQAVASDVSVPVVEQPRARVLLVEDNPVNLVVARRMLAKLGIDSLVARDGVEALAALQRERVDLILMDCQMPNMDGYQATQRIRATEQERPATDRLPVIAMTANVMPGDRDKCLAAGMDDFLGKPLDAAALRRTLDTWLGPDRSGRPDPASGAPAIADAPLDRQKLARLGELMGDELPRLIRQFLHTAGQLMRSVDRASVSDDLAAMARAAHSLKSSSANLGASQLSLAAARLEQACGDTAMPAVRGAHRDLQAAFSAAYAALEAELR